MSATGRAAGASALRWLAATVLFLVAVVWSGNPMWSGHTGCEATEGACDLSRMEAYAPASLWVVTAVGTLLACLIAAAIGPRAFRPRLAWALGIGAAVFVAHRHNMLWATVVTALSVYGIASSTTGGSRSRTPG